MKRIFILCFILAFFFHSSLEAQGVIGNYIKKKARVATEKAGEKADEEVDEEIDKQVDKGVEKIFNNIRGGDQEQSEGSEDTSAESEENQSGNYPRSQAALMKAFGASSSPANVKDSYNYTGNIKMMVQSWDKKGKSEGEMDYITYMNNEKSGFAMEFVANNQQTMMIFDLEEEAMIILTESDGQKTGIVSQYEGVDSLVEEGYEEYEESEEYENYMENLKKTGKSKTIAGYKCNEYLYEDEESFMNIWMTKELPADLWAKIVSSNVINPSGNNYYGGFVMEMTQNSKTDDTKMHLLVKEVNENQNTSINTTDYQLIQFGGGGFSGE